MVELEALEENLDQLQELGANVIALCPQLIEHNEGVEQDLGLSFPVATDTNNLAATAFKIRTEMPQEVIEAEQFLGLDLPTHNGTDNWDLPIPARYLVDRSGVIQFASIHVDHRLRTDPADLLQKLSSLTG